MQLPLKYLLPLFVLCGVLRAASGETVLYDGGRTLPPGWTLDVWGGVVAEIDASEIGSVRIYPKNEDVQAWAGAWLHTISGSAARLALPENGDKEPLYLNLQLRADRREVGSRFVVPLQIALAGIKTDGSVSQSSYQSLRTYRIGRETDATGTEWDLFSVPLEKLRRKAAAEIADISGLHFQYASASPVLEGFHLGKISFSTVPYQTADTSAAKAEPSATPSLFQELERRQAPFLLPRDTHFAIGPNGDWMHAGRPRFLIGAQMAERLRATYLPTSGYPEALRWIYEKPLDYVSAQRLGFDTIGLFMPPSWGAAIDPKRTVGTDPGDDAYVDDVLRRAGLPIYVDVTCAAWLHGNLLRSDKVPAAAKNSFGDSGPNNHFTPYSILHPEGRALYRKMFEHAALQVKRSGARPLYYELLNEPGYDDPNDYNKAAFARAMERKYGNIAALNKAWSANYRRFSEIAAFRARIDSPALFVEWTKFMEDAVTDLVKEGVETIRAIDKDDPKFAVQILGADYYRVLPKSNINLHKLSPHLSVMSLQTGGGIEGPGAGGLSAAPRHTIETPYVNPRFEGMMARRFFQSIAEGKPLIDGEHYFYAHPASDGFWLQLARGGNGAYIFHWTKRAWDPDWGIQRDAEGGRKLAGLYPYNVLNPYAVAPDKLADIAKAKEEILSLDDIFVPRANRSTPDIGLLLSYPTARYSQAAGTLTHNAFRGYGVALSFSHYDYSVLLEEHLPEGRLDRHKLLIAPGVGNVYDQTPSTIEKWVKKGGSLILGLEALQENELGRPAQAAKWLGLKLGPVTESDEGVLSGNFAGSPLIPGPIRVRAHRKIEQAENWTVLASVGKAPVILRREAGKGHVYYINVRMPDYALASVLGGILRREERLAIQPECQLTRSDNGELEVNVEVHRFRAGEAERRLTGYFLYNWDSYPKAFTFRGSELSSGTGLIDPLTGVGFEVSDGTATVWIPAQTKRVLVAGRADVLARRFGPLPVMNAAAVLGAAAAERDRLAAQARRDARADFSVTGDKLLTLDLRRFANRDFIDGVAGDGKGGWTDQGENSLQGAEWGHQVYRGVPFEIIRPDMNGGNGAIVLASRNMANAPAAVRDIPVGDGGAEKVSKLYFLHATAWSGNGTKAFSYVLNHPDGTRTEIPVRVGHEVGDWWIHKAGDLNETARVGWRNAEGKGLWACAWTNPLPEKPVTGIDIVSAQNAPVPLVIAITAELR